MTTSARSSQSIETFDYGVTRYYEANERIAVVRSPYNVARDAVDAWAMIMMDTLHNCLPEDRKFLLCDLSDKAQSLTPYARAKTEQLFASLPPESETYAAVVLPDTIAFRLIGTFATRRARQTKNVTLRVFNNYDEGLNWLRNLLTS